MNFISKNAVEISPEVLTNSWLYASLDMPGKKRGNRECKPYERLESSPANPFLLFGELRDRCATHAIVYVSAFFLAPLAEEPRGLAEEGRVGPTEVVGLCRTMAEGTVCI